MSVPTVPLLLDLLREALAGGQRSALTVTSESMRPLLRAGDRVILEGASPADLNPGDIVTIIHPTLPGQTLTHRFYTMVDGDVPQLVTRGDRVIRFDVPSPAARLIGRVVVRRRGDYDLSLVEDPGAWLNRRLAELAREEVHQVAGRALPLTPTPAELDAVARLAAANSRRLSFRFYRHLTRFRAAWIARGVTGQTITAGSAEWQEVHV